MTGIKLLGNGTVLIEISKCINGLYIAYIIRTRNNGGNEKILSSFCPNWLEETLINNYNGLKVL